MKAKEILDKACLAREVLAMLSALGYRVTPPSRIGRPPKDKPDPSDEETAKLAELGASLVEIVSKTPEESSLED